MGLPSERSTCPCQNVLPYRLSIVSRPGILALTSRRRIVWWASVAASGMKTTIEPVPAGWAGTSASYVKEKVRALSSSQALRATAIDIPSTPVSIARRLSRAPDMPSTLRLIQPVIHGNARRAGLHLSDHRGAGESLVAKQCQHRGDRLRRTGDEQSAARLRIAQERLLPGCEIVRQLYVMAVTCPVARGAAGRTGSDSNATRAPSREPRQIPARWPSRPKPVTSVIACIPAISDSRWPTVLSCVVVASICRYPSSGSAPFLSAALRIPTPSALPSTMASPARAVLLRLTRCG